MPRLSDLISESSKKELIAEKRKIKKMMEKECRSNKLPKEACHKQKKTSIGPGIPIPDFVAIDVETTGLDFKNDRIIEIGAIKFKEGKAAEEFSTFINPQMSIPSVITELTGISDNDLTGAPLFADISEKLVSFIDNLPLCGHQIEFDASFLKEELKRANKPALENQLLDTALLSRILLDPHGRFSLKEVCNTIGVSLDNAHRALHDAKASGEAAVRLIPKISDLPIDVRRSIAAYAPPSLIKTLMFKSLPDKRPEITANLPKVKHLSRLSSPNEYRQVERKVIEEVFGPDGKLASFVKSFRPREGQIGMARGVIDALNTHSIYIAEAGTGTGKSLAYLIPAAIWALENSFRVIVSTRTKNLQDQLISKELPVVATLLNNKLKYTVLKGRRNYICLNRFLQLLHGTIGNLSPRERFAILPLIVWVNSTDSGDIEEQNIFNPKWFSKIWNIISAEHQQCTHRRCPLYMSCFYQKARNSAIGSNIVVINHALFFTELCSGNSLFDTPGPIIFDEAHHLESCGHKFLRVELDTNRINLFFETVNNLIHGLEVRQEKRIYECTKELKAALKKFRKKASDFLDTVIGWVKEKGLTSDEWQIAYNEESFSNLTESIALQQVIAELSDKLQEIKQAVNCSEEIGAAAEPLGMEIQSCIEQTSQLKADLIYLVAAKTEEHVFWAEGNMAKGWAKLCGVPLDVGALLSDVWSQLENAVIFTSATLSISGSFDYFKQTVGLLRHEERIFEAVFKSPFGSHQSIAIALLNGPEVDSEPFTAYCASSIAALHSAFRRNILALFTSNSMLSAVYRLIQVNSLINPSSLLAQGVSGSRRTLLDDFKRNSGMILLGTESFWEGIDVPGEACEIVVITRLPFTVPTHPLTQALAKRMQEQNGESFYSYSVPEAVIRFRQGCGRLIRTSTDRGALVVLDNRIITRGYGKLFMESVDSKFNVFDNMEQAIEAMADFFENAAKSSDVIPDLTYVPLEDV